MPTQNCGCNNIVVVAFLAEKMRYLFFFKYRILDEDKK
jgi:hypothetical protein